jgi:acetoin utilization deacetylase AcuC-like enzyme
MHLVMSGAAEAPAPGAPPPPLTRHRAALQLAGGASFRSTLSPGARALTRTAPGTHHAFRDRGEGFCVFNDMAVAAAAALHTRVPAAAS